MRARRHPTLVPIVLALAALTSAPPAARAQWSGAITEPLWSVAGGGAVGVTGGAYRLSGAAGAPEAAALTGGAYRISAGFWTPPGGGAPTEVAGPAVPDRFAFAPIAPNPFQGTAEIAFDLPARARVRAEVFDVRGERVRVLVDESRAPGRYREHWDGTDSSGRPLGAGVYFVRVRAAGDDVTRRVVRLD